MNDPAAAASARTQVLERIREDERFVLATHESPDGDALGSLVGMHGLLAELGKDSEIFIAPEDLPLPLEYRIFSLESLIQAPPVDIARRTVVFLDCGNIDRNSARVLRDGAHLLNLDHHHDNTRFGTVNHVDDAASCTAEIIWDLMGALGLRAQGDVADALYVGLVTDTGRFMYDNTGSRAHVMAAELIQAGVDTHEIYRHLYEGMPFAKLQLLARALGKAHCFDDGHLTLSWLSAADFGETGSVESYSEGVIDHLRSVEGTAVAVLVRELLDRVGRKVSLRATDGRVDVSAIARSLGGGGHRQAAGATTELPLEQLIDQIRQEIRAQL